MPRNSQAELETEAAGLRAGLKESLGELHRRSTPTRLFGVAREAALEKGRAALGEGMDYVKEHGAAATIAGAGAILAFDLGRRSGSPQTTSAGIAENSEGSSVPGTEEQRKGLRGKAANIGDTALILSEALGGALIGSALATAIPVTTPERELLGELPSEAKSALQKFVQEHKDGMRQTAAQAFGIANAATWLLALLAIAADRLQPRPGHHAT